MELPQEARGVFFGTRLLLGPRADPAPRGVFDPELDEAVEVDQRQPPLFLRACLAAMSAPLVEEASLQWC